MDGRDFFFPLSTSCASFQLLLKRGELTPGLGNRKTCSKLGNQSTAWCNIEFSEASLCLFPSHGGSSHEPHPYASIPLSLWFIHDYKPPATSRGHQPWTELFGAAGLAVQEILMLADPWQLTSIMSQGRLYTFVL